MKFYYDYLFMRVISNITFINYYKILLFVYNVSSLYLKISYGY